MQTSFDVPLQMILTGIAALAHSHCRYKTGLPITSSYYQKPLLCDPFLSYCCKQVVATHTCFHLHPALLHQRIIRLASPRLITPRHTTKTCGFSSIPLIMMGIHLPSRFTPSFSWLWFTLLCLLAPILMLCFCRV
jgi:hypothetical protein